MRRRTLIQWLAAVLPAAPFARVTLGAQTRALTPEAVAVLREVAGTVLPASLGAERIGGVVDGFVQWTEGYEEGVPVSHGYGHPRLARTKASPVPDYVAQLARLDAAARRRGGSFASLDLETRRTLLDEAMSQAGVKALPPRPDGTHVAADLMAFFFRSSAANDLCHEAAIGRQTCRPIRLTTRRPAPLQG